MRQELRQAVRHAGPPACEGAAFECALLLHASAAMLLHVTALTPQC
jgi:hypothetical protein